MFFSELSIDIYMYIVTAEYNCIGEYIMQYNIIIILHCVIIYAYMYM